MKTFKHTLFTFSFLISFLPTVLQAEEPLDLPISFSPVTEFMNVACDGGDRDVVYNLVNTEANTINLDNIHVITNIDDTATGLTTSFVSGGCIDTIHSNNTASGSITGYTTGFATCQITLTVTPPACPTGGILQETIDRQLYIGVETREQSELIAEIDAEVSVMGAGAYFALLANSSTSPMFGVVASNGTSSAQISGDIGSSGTSTPGNFSISNGTFYNAQNTSPNSIYTAAVNDLTQAYTQLSSMTGCTAINGLNNESKGPGCYILAPSSGTIVTVQGANELTGTATTQNYYFFVPPGINLDIDADTVFTFTNPDNSSAANVFWIMLNASVLTYPAGPAGQVLIDSGAQLEGSVLSGSTTLVDATSPAITTTSAGTNHAQVNGTLWSAAPAATSSPNSTIQLYGDTISAVTQ
ncbi:MAG: hypothetical protein WC748_09310 [Legionellales bacterium]